MVFKITHLPACATYVVSKHKHPALAQVEAIPLPRIKPENNSQHTKDWNHVMGYVTCWLLGILISHQDT